MVSENSAGSCTAPIRNFGINITNRGDRLPVEILQGVLDKYLETHDNVEIDYIHGDEALHGLVKETKGCGIFLQSIDKSTLFLQSMRAGCFPERHSQSEKRMRRDIIWSVIRYLCSFVLHNMSILSH